MGVRMRFKTEQEGLQSLIGKKIPDPRYLRGRVAPRMVDAFKLMRHEENMLKEDFDVWLDAKRLMFSPEEQIALTGVDQRGRKGSVSQEFRNRVVNVFVAWVEGKPLKQELIAVGPLKTEISRVD